MGLFDRFFGPPTREKFATLMQLGLRAVGDERQSTFVPDDFRIDFTTDGKRDGIMHLANLYATYCKLPAGVRRRWLKDTCLAMANQMEVPDDFEDVKPDLLPVVRSRSFVDAIENDLLIDNERVPPVVHVPISEHLVVCLAYDMPRTLSIVNEERLKKWGVTVYEALEAARYNLDEKEGQLISVGNKLFICDTDDAYDASRMLKIDKIRELPLTGDPVAMPMNRDCLLIAGADDVEGLGLMVGAAETIAENPRPVCFIPHRLIGEEWHPWMPDESHEHYEKFHELATRFIGSEYSEQKDALEKRNEKTGTDVFVATLSAMQNEQTKKVRSYATWSKGVPTWLPKADLIGFYNPDDESSRLVAWEAVVAELGSEMTALPYYPPRWSVTSFPTAEQLERMGSASV